MAIVMDVLSCHRDGLPELSSLWTVVLRQIQRRAVAAYGHVLFAVDEPCISEGWWMASRICLAPRLVSLKACDVHLIWYSWAARNAQQ